MTQESMVYEHLLKLGSITSMEAFSAYKITRLSDRIYRLRAKGVPVDTIDEQTTVNGRPCTFRRYILRKEK